MIRGHVALVRQLHSFMETSNLPWLKAAFRYDHDDDGRNIYDDHRAEISFPYLGKTFQVVIFAPSDDVNDHERLPLGRLAARVDGGEVVKGPIDTATWLRIMDMIRKETAGVPTAC